MHKTLDINLEHQLLLPDYINANTAAQKKLDADSAPPKKPDVDAAAPPKKINSFFEDENY